MSEPFVGEIRMFAGNFAPRGWAFCDGQMLAINQNQALFSLLGTIYGGDGHTTFGLPDLRGRIPIHAGTGPGLSPRQIGVTSGEEETTLNINELPHHAHSAIGTTNLSTSGDPTGRFLAQVKSNKFYDEANPTVYMAADTLRATGGSLAHNNMMPYLCINFIVALNGIYPSRN